MNSREERELMEEADEIFRETDADLKVLGIKAPADMAERLSISYKLGPRRGDAAEMAIIKLVD